MKEKGERNSTFLFVGVSPFFSRERVPHFSLKKWKNDFGFLDSTTMNEDKTNGTRGESAQ